MKYYIIAGESSGDLHASHLMRSLKEEDAQAEFRCWGGDLMKKQGGELVQHYKEMSYMGFLEVVSHLPTVLSKLRFCKRDLKQYKPDVLVLIDYPGFNLRIAKYAKSIGLKVVYYISPKVWAWNTSRVRTIKRVVDKMFVIFPFEEEFYKRYDYDVAYIGNPLVDIIKSRDKNDNFLSDNSLDDRPIISLLPGSRKQEIQKVLPIMLQLPEKFKNHQFLVGIAPSIPLEDYKKIISETNCDSKVKLIHDQTYDMLSHSEATVVTSGTVSLEAAILNIPQVVCYKSSKISYKIAKSVIKVKYISLVNLIMNKEVVKELIQDGLTIEQLVVELNQIREGSLERARILSDYDELNQMLQSGDKTASGLAAKEIVKMMYNKLTRLITLIG